MNLFYKPSISELAHLIEQNIVDSGYNVIVDYDGEVLIDAPARLTSKTLDKFKFYFNDMHERASQMVTPESYLKFLNKLFKSLVFCWEQEITGQVDYKMISKIQDKIYDKELKEIRKKAYPVRMDIVI